MSKSRSLRSLTFFTSLAILTILIRIPAAAQYTVTNLTSNQTGGGNNIDPQLVNAWGIAYGPGGPFWVSDNGTGVSTLYDATGAKQSLVVTIPTSTGLGTGSPTDLRTGQVQDPS